MSDSDLTDEEQRHAIITTITLDISNKHLKEVPKTIKNFNNIEFLYLSTNDIRSIPDRFFLDLPQLKWLDFRHNNLTSIPATIGQHRELRTLLLQGNQLTRLPIELGNVPTITGLNIAGNPLDYPPKTVLQEGTHKILKFLRIELQKKLLLIPELLAQLEDLHIVENEGYLGSGEDDMKMPSVTSIKRISRKKSHLHDAGSPLTHRSATLQPRQLEKFKWSSSDTIITTQPRLPKARKKFKSASTAPRVRHSDHYIKKAMQEFEEKRMQAIKKEENSRTEMMVQRMRDREALKQWRQENNNQNSQIGTPRSRAGTVQLKRLEKSRKSGPSVEEMIGFISTQLATLICRENRVKYQTLADGGNREQLITIRGLIERKQMELSELKRKQRMLETVLMKSHTMDSIRPLKQKPVGMSEQELALRNRIKEHANKLREYHKSDNKSKNEAVINMQEAGVIHGDMQRFNQEYRFKAFTGELADI